MLLTEIFVHVFQSVFHNFLWVFKYNKLHFKICSFLLLESTAPKCSSVKVGKYGFRNHPLYALQMKGQCESKINVWIPFMYSQKWKYAASLFPKQNYNVLSPSSFTHISVRDLYIPMIGLPILLQPNMWILGIYKSLNTHECGNLDWGCAIPRKGKHIWDFCCSVVRVSYTFTGTRYKD